MHKLLKLSKLLALIFAIFVIFVFAGLLIGFKLVDKLNQTYTVTPVSFAQINFSDPFFPLDKNYYFGGKDGLDIKVDTSIQVKSTTLSLDKLNYKADPQNKYVFKGALNEDKLMQILEENLLNQLITKEEKFKNLKIENLQNISTNELLFNGNSIELGVAEIFMGNCNFFNELGVLYNPNLKKYEFSGIQTFTENLCEVYKVPENYIEMNCTDCMYYPVDKKHRLTNEYAIEVINTDGIPGGQTFSKEHYKNLLDLYLAAKAAGHNMRLTSAYRSYFEQEKVFEGWVQYEMGFGKSRAQAESDANSYSALPGFSEHQLGTTADISSLDCIGIETFCASNENLWRWLRENAHTYGFVMSYPPGKEQQTGYIYEPWHYRFIGTELAQEFKQKYEGRSYLAEFLRNKKLYLK